MRLGKYKDNDYNILYFDRSDYKIDLKTMFMEEVLLFKIKT